MAQICRLPKVWQRLKKQVINANIGDISDTLHSQVPSQHVHQKRLLELKAPTWKEWAFTDGSCITNKANGSQSTGAGVYHPQSIKITTINTGGTSNNKTINRAEIAEFAAALINEHTHIATDSVGALWQIRNSIFYPQRMTRHKCAQLLETIVHQIKLFKDTINLYKVEAHAGILGKGALMP